MKKIIYRYSILGFPFGLLGLFFDVEWIRNFFFLIGRCLCGLGRIIGAEIEARRTLEKNGIDPTPIFGDSPLSKRQKSLAERLVHGCAILGLVAGLFNFAVGPGWIRKLLLVVLGLSSWLIWFLDRDEK